MAVKVRLLWSKDGKECVGSVRYDTKYFDDNVNVLIPYDRDGNKDMIVSSVAMVTKAVLTHLKQKTGETNDKSSQ